MGESEHAPMRSLIRNFFAALALAVCVPVLAADPSPADQILQAKRSYWAGDVAIAIEKLTALAEAGHADAQWNLARLRLEGAGPDADARIGARWLRRAAIDESGGAMRAFGGPPPKLYSELTRIYENGVGVGRDRAFAAQWASRAYDGQDTARSDLKRLADAGVAEAQFLLADKLYLAGTDDGANAAAARRYAEAAAGQGHRGAMRFLAEIIEMDVSGPADLARARSLLLEAARLGDGMAILKLARSLTPAEAAEIESAARADAILRAIGSGDPRAALFERMFEPEDFDPEDARRVWMRLAANGEAESILNLARLAPNAPAEAPARHAAYVARAQAGEAEAMFLAGLTSMHGVGVATDRVQAARWFEQAYAAGWLQAAYFRHMLYEESTKAGAPDSVAWLRRAVRAGYGPALFNDVFSDMSGDRKSVAARREEADLLAAAAMQGHLAAFTELQDRAPFGFGPDQMALARVLSVDDDLIRDPAAAHRWTRLAAEYGDPEAMYVLALAYGRGDDGSPDLDAMTFWMSAAIEADYPPALVRAADAFREDRETRRFAADFYGRALRQGAATAEERLRAMVAAGSPDAAVHLGRVLLETEGDAALDEALQLFRRAASAGEAQAMAQLGALHETGRGVPKDRGAMLDWLRKAAAAGHTPIKRVLAAKLDVAGASAADKAEAAELRRSAAAAGDALAAMAYARRLPPEAATPWLTQAAAAGVAEAQARLGHAYLNGDGAPQDDAEARIWLGRAAAQEDAGALFTLGRLDWNSDTAAGRLAAHQAMERAARLGHAEAQYRVAKAFVDDERRYLVEDAALKYLERAAKSGHAAAQAELGLLYEDGRIVARDTVEAAAWYRKAAAAGDALALNNLAALHRRGDGVEADDAEAARLFRRSAEAGYAVAAYNLAAMYYQGVGVAEDMAEARVWFVRAAEGGDPDGQWAAGMMAADGLGGPVDSRAAFRWRSAGAAQDHGLSMAALAESYLEGVGVASDAATAFAWAARAFFLDPDSAADVFFAAAEALDAAGRERARRLAAPHLGPGDIVTVVRIVLRDELPGGMSEAVAWAELAAVQGHVGAQVFVAEAYEAGDGVARDLEKAGVWRIMAAAAGDSESLMRAGEMYDRGEGVEADPGAAADYYGQAAAQGQEDALRRLTASAADGDPHAAYHLALLYADGAGVSADADRAEALYRQAAAAGLAEAKNDLGSFYESRERFDAAAEWYRSAADAGSALGAANLGALLLQGKGAPQDFAEAARLFRSSAKAGEPIGMYNLARLLGRGEGVALDVAEAYYWARRAEATGDDRVEGQISLMLFALGRTLPPEQAAEIDARVAAEAGQ